MLGHVNNVRYLTYFETVRTEHLYNFSKKHNVNSMAVILARSEIDYKAPAKWGDELTVMMRTISVGNSSWVYEYEVVNNSGILIASGKSVQVAYDYEKQSSIAIPERIREELVREMEETKG